MCYLVSFTKPNDEVVTRFYTCTTYLPLGLKLFLHTARNMQIYMDEQDSA